MKSILAYCKKSLLLFLLLFPLVLFAQDNSKATKAQKKQERKEQEKIKKEHKEKLKAIKFHNKIQDKATRKRMKKHRRQVDEHTPY